MSTYASFALGYVIGATFALIVDCCLDSKKPQPIDVYRGKTTLQITYKDSIPVDSVVVFK